MVVQFTVRDAKVDVPWDQVETAIRVALGLAVANLKPEWNGRHATPERSGELSITVDEQIQRDWKIARMTIAGEGAKELLLVRQLLNERGGDIGADYALVMVDDHWQSVTSGPIQKVAHIDRPDDGMLYCFAGPGDKWEEEWDQALVLLRWHRYRDE